MNVVIQRDTSHREASIKKPTVKVKGNQVSLYGDDSREGSHAVVTLSLEELADIARTTGVTW